MGSPCSLTGVFPVIQPDRFGIRILVKFVDWNNLYIYILVAKCSDECFPYPESKINPFLGMNMLS